jgi:hypothetical protein
MHTSWLLLLLACHDDRMTVLVCMPMLLLRLPVLSVLMDLLSYLILSYVVYWRLLAGMLVQWIHNKGYGYTIKWYCLMLS